MARKKNNPTILTMPPFPPLISDGSQWLGRITLNSWKGFQIRLGTDQSEIVGLCVSPAEPPPMQTSSKQPPSAAQADAYRDWMDREHVIHDRIVRAIAEFYNSVAQVYIDYGVPDLPPALDSPDQLRGLIELSWVHVLVEAKDGVPYIGYQFVCEWDGEHGLGVMTHREEVVAVGQADTAFCPQYPDMNEPEFPVWGVPSAPRG